MPKQETNWPDHPATAAEEAEHRRRRLENEPLIGAHGPGRGQLKLFRRHQRPPPLVVIELPSDEDADG
jgi:hypothetical protein